MIVIASHDNVDCLSNILQDMDNCDLASNDVLIIDTNSKDKNFKDRFLEFKNIYPRYIFERLDYDCWDSGAYIHAYKKYSSDKYVFLQDSLRVTNPNIFKIISERLNNTDILGLFNFFYSYDSTEQKNWAEDGIPFNSLPDCGIFGPIFSINKNSMDKIPNDWLKYPTNKMQACGMERRWALMFHTLGLKKEYLVEFKNNIDWMYHESNRYQTDYCLQYLSKEFKHRI